MYYSPQNMDTYSSSPATTRTLELRLMHHYTMMTASTLAAGNTAVGREAWKVTVPNLAFEAPCLMDALLAVSALHLRSLCPDKSLVRASHGYMASALSKYSSALSSGIDMGNAETLFIASALIAFQTSTSRQFMIEDGSSEPENAYVVPLAWFQAFQGVKAVVMASWQWLRGSQRLYPIIDQQPALRLDLWSDKPKFFSPLLEGLEDQLRQEDEQQRCETRWAYEHSVACLSWAHQRPERAGILGFPATVSRRFVELIAEKDPRALVIVACFFAMTRAVDDVWWLKGVAKREVTGLMTMLPSEWWSKMDWAVRIATMEGSIDEDTWGAALPGVDEPSQTKTLEDRLHTHLDILTQIAPELS